MLRNIVEFFENAMRAVETTTPERRVTWAYINSAMKKTIIQRTLVVFFFFLASLLPRSAPVVFLRLLRKCVCVGGVSPQAVKGAGVVDGDAAALLAPEVFSPQGLTLLSPAPSTARLQHPTAAQA